MGNRQLSKPSPILSPLGSKLASSTAMLGDGSESGKLIFVEALAFAKKIKFKRSIALVSGSALSHLGIAVDQALRQVAYITIWSSISFNGCMIAFSRPLSLQ